MFVIGMADNVSSDANPNFQSCNTGMTHVTNPPTKTDGRGGNKFTILFTDTMLVN